MVHLVFLVKTTLSTKKLTAGEISVWSKNKRTKKQRTMTFLAPGGSPSGKENYPERHA